MLPSSRQYRRSELIWNKTKQVILIFFLLCLIPIPNSPSPLAGIPTTLTQMCFLKLFHPVWPHRTVFGRSMKFRFWQNTRPESSEMPRSTLQCRSTVTREVRWCCHFQLEQKEKRRVSVVLLLIVQPRSSVLARALIRLSQSWFDNRRGQGCRTCFKFKVFCVCSWQAEENCTTGSRNGSSTGDGTSHCEEKHWREESLASLKQKGLF